MSKYDSCNMAAVQAVSMKVIDKYTEVNPLFMSSPKYKESIVNHTIREVEMSIEESILPYAFLEILDKELWMSLHDPSTKYLKSKLKTAKSKILRFCVSTSVDLYLSMNYMKRSEPYDDYEGVAADKAKTTATVDYVRNKPQPPQRTPAWYEFRNNLITASNAWKALKSKSSKTQLINEKCKELDISKYDTTNVNTNTAFHHGTKYEEISVMFYEHKYKTKVEDFGCIRHDKYHCLGASPDGINTCESSPLFGRMLEIKNPVSREINGIPKEEYWIQMQLQMEVCNLDVCDFLETLIKEYENEEEFLQDSYPTSEVDEKGEPLSEFTHTKKKQLKGVIMYFSGKNGPIYEYMPLYISKSEYENWSAEMFLKHQNITWLKNIFWYMKEYSCVVVQRNKHWFQHAIPHIQDTWKQVEKTREKGGVQKKTSTLPQVRTSKARSRSNSTIEDTLDPAGLTNIKSGCLLNLDEGDIVSVSVGVESESTKLERQRERETAQMKEEDTNSSVHEVICSIICSILSRCEQDIKVREAEEIKVTSSSSSSPPPPSSPSPQANKAKSVAMKSPLTRAAKKKNERKENKKVENVIYIDT